MAKNNFSLQLKLLLKTIEARRVIQAIVGLAFYLAVANYNVPLIWVIVFGSAIGIILGKIFCRWMCPMGFIMEMMMSSGDSDAKLSHMYQYFKLGCPIAWISGVLNKVSLLKVKLNPSTCISCGKCDKACYIAINNSSHSLHKGGLTNSSAHYSCSRCLNCISSCPAGALTLAPLADNTIPLPIVEKKTKKRRKNKKN
jgi:polyferredoxin